jgi:hypothetical protein
MSTGPYFDMSGSTFHAPVAKVAHNSGVINQAINNGLDTAAIADWIASLQAVLPSAQLSSNHLAQIDSSLSELKAQLDTPQQNPGLIRQTMSALLAKLPEAISTAAISKAPVVLQN